MRWVLLLLLFALQQFSLASVEPMDTFPPTHSPTSPPTNYYANPEVSVLPTIIPSFAPVVPSQMTGFPTSTAVNEPTALPSVAPTSSPTYSPVLPRPHQPTDTPSTAPTQSPSSAPTGSPSHSPTLPTPQPTQRPTFSPTPPTTFSPTREPTLRPTRSPTPPTHQPTQSPSHAPTTSKPTQSPTLRPTGSPTTSKPTQSPITSEPTLPPTTPEPTRLPTLLPTRMPTSKQPTLMPTSKQPTLMPTLMPTMLYTEQPTEHPTGSPIISLPTSSPSAAPMVLPNNSPTTFQYTNSPAFQPLNTSQPTVTPTNFNDTTPVYVSPTASPTFNATHAPTLHSPSIVSAVFNSDITRLEIQFNLPTNQNSTVRKPCSHYVKFPNVTDSGCGYFAPCELYCTWRTPSHLTIELNSKSTFREIPSVVVLTAAGQIRHELDVLPNLELMSSIQVPTELTAPSVTVSGPATVPLCGKPVMLTATVAAAGSGGRIPAFQWLANGLVLIEPGANSSTFIPAKPVDAQTVMYSVQITNWYGLEITSTAFTVTYVNDALVQTVLSVPHNFTVAATAQIKIQATVAFPLECVPANKSSADIQYSYLWKVTLITDRANPVPLDAALLPSAPTVRFNPASILPPGNLYAISLLVDSGLNVTGTAYTEVYVAAVPVVAALATPTSFSVEIEANKSVSISAARSCDPNVAVPVCDAASGQPAGLPASQFLQFTWTCTTRNGTDCSALCVSDGFVPSTRGVCEFLSTLLAESESPYVFSARVQNSNSWAQTANIVVTVLRALQPECKRPQVTILPFPAKINVGENGEAPIRSLVFGATPQTGLLWEYVDNNGIASSVANYVASGVTLNQLNLVLQLGKLSAGREYVFRLTATLPCTQGSNNFGQVVFKTNSAPMGGALQVNTLHGVAASTEFVFTASAFTDEDLPLEYMFEYAATSTTAVYAPLSSFQQSLVLTTTLAQADSVTVVARCRDALGAITSRAASPQVSGISISPFLLVAGALPPNAEESIKSLLSAGGSNEDALRFANALAASTSSIDLSTADDSVKQWLLESQSTMLDLVGSTREEGAEPSAVLLQSSALASILRGSTGLQDAATEQGALFLSKATGMVGNLLEDAKAAVVAKGAGGQADPMLSQYVPADLGSITLSSLEDILSSISTSSLNQRRRRRRLAETSNQESVSNTRQRLRELVDVLLLGSVPGSEPKSIPGAQMSIVCVRQTPAMIGTNQFNQISIPAFDNSEPDTVINLPMNVLQSTLAEVVNIHAVRFRFNIRELVSSGALPNYTLDANAPTNRVEEMLSLDFAESSQSALLHPTNLAFPIQINLTLRWEDVPTNMSTHKLACGYWDDAVGSWSGAGCNLTAYALPPSPQELGWQLCSCNHASDYAVWQAFIRDITSVFIEVDLTALTLISTVVIAAMLPLLVGMWLCGVLTSRRKDERDRAMVHLGTFVSITQKKLELTDRKRRFFKMLRDNQYKGKATISAKQVLLEIKRQAQTVELHGEAAVDRIKHQAKEEYFAALFGLMMRTFGLTTLFVASLLFASVTTGTFSNATGSALNATEEMFPVFVLTAITATLQLSHSLAALVWSVKIKRRHTMIGWLASVQLFFIVPLGFAAMIMSFTLVEVNSVDTGLGLLIAGACLSLVTCGMVFGAYGFQHQRGALVWRHFLENVAKGMVYEQSLVSLITRYDPYFDRIQRTSIVLAVIVGNLFVESFFFAFKESPETSVELMIGVIILAALVVAIPVKICIRALFRVTKSRVGSPEDRVAQIFRVIAFSNDVNPGMANRAAAMDTKMLASFKRFYTVEAKIRLIQEALVHERALEEDRQRLERGLPPKYTHEFFLWYSLLGNAVCLLAVGVLLAVIPGFVAPAVISLVTAVLTLALVFVPAMQQRAYWLFRFLFVLNLATRGLVWGFAADAVVRQPEAIAASVISALGFVAFSYAQFVYLFRAPENLKIQRFPRHRFGMDRSAMLAEQNENRRIQSLRLTVVEDERESASSPIVLREQLAVRKKTNELVSDNPMNNTTSAPNQIRRDLLDAQILHSSSRFERHAKGAEKIHAHPLMMGVYDENGMVIPQALVDTEEERHMASQELKLVIKESRAAWLETNAYQLSAKQLAVRHEQSLMLKFATVLAEEPSQRPRIVRKLFPPTFIYFSWVCLAVYYIGGLTWVSYWVLTRDQNSARILQEASPFRAPPTREEISIETNAILSAWLWASFLGVCIGYFVAEPIVLVCRHGLFNAVLEMSHPEEVEPTPREWVAKVIADSEEQQQLAAAAPAAAAEKQGVISTLKIKPNMVLAGALDVTCEIIETLA